MRSPAPQASVGNDQHQKVIEKNQEVDDCVVLKARRVSIMHAWKLRHQLRDDLGQINAKVGKKRKKTQVVRGDLLFLAEGGDHCVQTNRILAAGASPLIKAALNTLPHLAEDPVVTLAGCSSEAAAGLAALLTRGSTDFVEQDVQNEIKEWLKELQVRPLSELGQLSSCISRLSLS